MNLAAVAAVVLLFVLSWQLLLPGLIRYIAGRLQEMPGTAFTRVACLRLVMSVWQRLHGCSSCSRTGALHVGAHTVAFFQCIET